MNATNNYKDWAVCTVYADGSIRRYSSNEEGQAKAWGIHIKQDHPYAQVLLQRYRDKVYELVPAPGVIASTDPARYVWEATDTYDVSVRAPEYKVEVTFHGLGATWFFEEYEKAITFAINQKAISTRSTITLTEPEGRVLQVQVDGRIQEKKPDDWILTTYIYGPPPFGGIRHAKGTYDNHTQCLAAALQAKWERPKERVTVTDPAGIERELQLMPVWAHVQPIPLEADPFYTPVSEEGKRWYQYADIFTHPSL